MLIVLNRSPRDMIRRTLYVFLPSMITALMVATSASAQLRVVSYNIARLMGDSDSFQYVLTEMGLDDKPGFAVPPHVIVFQEVTTTNVAPLTAAVQAAHPGIPYVAGTYTNFNENFVGGAQAMFYRSDLLTEDTAAHTDIFTGAGRFTDRWRLTLNGYDNDDAAFYIYSSHLKASTGSANEQLRLEGVQAIRADAATLPAGSLIIYAGDLNLYENTEPAYQAFIAPGPGQALDPLGTGPWAGSSFAIKHTQSPRLTSQGGLVGGGMDDRFDFQLSTSRFHDGAGLSIMPGTYRALGNDGNKWNQSINNGNNFYYFWDVPRSNALADALFEASDHIPVVADYQLPARIHAHLPPNFGPVLQGAPTTVTLTVSNDAPAIVPNGADTLSYAATTAGALTGTYSGEAEPLGPALTHQVTINTFVPGTAVSGAVQVNSSSQGAGNNPVLLQTIGTVLRRSQASFAPTSFVNFRNVEAVAVAGGPVIDIEIPIYAANWNAPQAWIDVTSLEGTASDHPFAVMTPTLSQITDSAGIVLITFDPSSLSPGPYSAFTEIDWSEQPLPGAVTGSLFATINVTVEPGNDPGLTGDLNGDGVVNSTDLLILLNSWGPCPSPPEECPADLNESGAVDSADLLILLENWS